ncbi:MAG: metallophosphoesterase family protein [Pseudomonadota bacterium]
MEVVDLGELHGDVWLFGGVYSNFSALEAFLNAATDVPTSNLLCSGDVVAYCARGEACVQKLRDRGGPVLAGNCEVQIAAQADDCGCGYSEGSTCSILSRGWYAHALKTISPASRDWMAGLPERIIFTHAGQRWVLVHGAASEIARFVWPVTSDGEISAEIALLRNQVGLFDGVIAGHTGLQMDRTVDGVRWVNPGALGMPANNGRAKTGYAVLTEQGLRMEQLAYDPAEEIKAMKAAGLTQGYHETLKSGWWPSEDTLPPEMRRNLR